jgi:1-deoxy-D-xylulose-5-phosphate synthase
VAVQKEMSELPWGKGEVRRQGRRVAILAFGSMVAPALVAGESLDATVVNMRFVKPLDTALLEQMALSHDLLVTVEENVVAGGAGAACAEALAGLKLATPMLHLGLPDQFIDHGDPAKLLALQGLDAAGIQASISRRIQQMPVPALKKSA